VHVARLLRIGTGLYFAPRAVLGLTITVVLGLAAALLVIQGLILVVRTLGV
jgi:hypothetical protein